MCPSAIFNELSQIQKERLVYSETKTNLLPHLYIYTTISTIIAKREINEKKFCNQ